MDPLRTLLLNIKQHFEVSLFLDSNVHFITIFLPTKKEYLYFFSHNFLLQENIDKLENCHPDWS